MRYGKMLVLTSAALLGMTLSAGAQLGVGGAVQSTTCAVGNVGGQTGAVNGTLDSTTRVGTDLDSNVNGNLHSATRATAKTDATAKRRPWERSHGLSLQFA